MASLEQIIQFQLALTGEAQRRFGDKTTPVNLTVNGQVWDSSNIVVADNFGNVTLWQSPQGGLTSFQYLLFTSNADVWLELANTVPATDERLIIFVAANSILALPSGKMGGYASNVSRFDGAVMVSGTDYNFINEIRVDRDVTDLAGDATVRLMLVN